jgi:hypothetical protein
MRRRKLLARGGLAVLLLAALLTTAQSSQADDEPEWYPGLPDTTFGTWSNAAQGGLSYARRAKQWFRTPAAMVVAEVAIIATDDDLTTNYIRAEANFVSPKGAPANYGYLAPMTVRSVGFGLMPVEATVQVSQRRVDGYPAPLKVLLTRKYSATGANPNLLNHVKYLETLIQDSLEVRILSVRVDGVDLGLNGDCRTVEPAPVTLRTPVYDRPANNEREWYRTHDPSTYWDAIFGGEMNGSMTIPPFTGCTTTAGDDLSRLMTLSVSGADNPVVARSGWPCDLSENGAAAPLPPGAASPKLATEAGAKAGGLTEYCPGPKPFDYPEREDR